MLICLTPTKNESWTLDRFVPCTATWADQIVVADQGSCDSSREIVKQYSRVTLIDNSLQKYDEGARQRMLIDAARGLEGSGKRVLIALDADEFLSANFRDSPEWPLIQAAEPGTVLYFDWVNILP